MPESAWSTSRIRRRLLACGIVAPLLYAVTDALGGLVYPGYSFSSQAVSELMAIGAPSEPFVDPLFMLYGALSLLFAVAVFREGIGHSRVLVIVGFLLLGQAALGFTGPTLFEMHQRDTLGAGSDLPHIILTGVLVLFTLITMGYGAFALARRFRIYTFATMAIVVLFGVLSAPYGARLAAGEPTPALGIIERIIIYTSQLWVAVLAIALLRRPHYGEEQ
jgi:hypothetical protein